MSDVTELPVPTQEEQEQIEQVVKEVKRGFSLRDRLEKRGLRKVTVTLFLDENLGAEHGAIAKKVKVIDERVAELNQFISRTEGEVADQFRAERDSLLKEREPLEAERATLEERLRNDALVINLRAVPPVIQKDCRRRAKQSTGIEGKDIPADKTEDFVQSFNAHLLVLTAQSITDTSSNETNDGIAYQDAIDLLDLLPSGQGERLTAALSEVQFRDAFSEAVEAQEDFS